MGRGWIERIRQADRIIIGRSCLPYVRRTKPWRRLCELIHLLDSPRFYRWWQAPFARAKFAPIRRCNDLSQVRRVLDVGCGPGISFPEFAHTDYLGIDLSARYVKYACQLYGDHFQVADVRELDIAEGKYDFVVLNSLLHHLDDEVTMYVLNHLRRGLAHDGTIHVIELVLPAAPGLPRLLAKCDRGNYPRSADKWRDLWQKHFDPVVFEPFVISWLGVPLWRLIYFKGRPR